VKTQENTKTKIARQQPTAFARHFVAVFFCYSINASLEVRHVNLLHSSSHRCC